MPSQVSINGSRLLGRLDAFAAIGATEKGGVNRQALTLLDRQARQTLTQLAMQRGFKVFQDPAANLFIRREGRKADLPPVLVGSHLDSQPSGGRFDGALGTLCAFEVLETLEDHAIKTERAVEVVAFMNEEGCRFAPGCMGSMAFAAGEIPADWASLTATDGAAFQEELHATLASLPEAEMRSLGFPMHAYLELHIEQGPSLEKENIPIGVVTGIQGTRWLDVSVKGQTAHAGTTALEYRRDPMRVVAQILAELYGTVMPSDPSVRFTVGRMSLVPGAINAIPETVHLTIDLRHPARDAIDRYDATIRDAFSQGAARYGCISEIKQIFDMPAANFRSDIVKTVEAAAIKAGLASKRMLSGAFHDALFVNRIAPAGMIFVPCRDGLSHNEAEHVEPKDSVQGCYALLLATIELAS
ncbi:Zn-dependent hydrolase [Oryzifoliimicrobium ureilyticus]|uniref:Zn-dependent hydrolase n=1 Tax=Oryzifoliimicrobium ureilyticus TaxID=3113724 RepID=UPI0030762E6B